MHRLGLLLALGGVTWLGCSGEGGGGRDTATASAGTITTTTTSGSASGTDSATTGTATDGSASATSNGTDPSTSGSDTDSGGTGNVKFDLPPLPDAPPPPEDQGCTKVDLLFIIDNSGSMADEQDNLQASFAGFINGIQTNLEGADDYHVGVITTDAYTGNAPGCTALGNLVTQTSGTDSSNAVCTPFADGNRFMTQNDDLITKFSCAAKPGSVGSGSELPMDAVRAALSPAQNMAGACNAGFIRNDALLVLVFITDEEDDHEPIIGGSAGDPPDWFNDIVAVKSGIQENIVVLALIGHPKPNNCPPDQWDGFNGAEIATRIIQFTNNFINGSYGDVCAPSYEGFFNDAISVVDSACDNFQPPG